MWRNPGTTMKLVLSISLGSTQGDHQTVVQVAGEEYLIQRMGTDGSLQRMQQLIGQYDGKAVAIGLGGINFAYVVGTRRYPLPQAQNLRGLAVHTQLVDGAMVKDTIERLAVEWLQRRGEIELHQAKVLVVSVLDRFGLAEEMERLGAQLTVGDALFGLGLPVPFYSLKSFAQVARLTMPMLRWLPIQYLYPTGDRQLVNRPRWAKYFAAAQYIAGDGHYIYRYMPADLKGKTIITGTVTTAALDEFRKRGCQKVITTSPWWQGRAFGANVLEALMIAVYGEANQANAHKLINQLYWRPEVIHF